MTGHCPTCKCTSVQNQTVYCTSTAQRKHETFKCIEEANHEGPHRSFDGAYPPCTNCDGIDLHADDCPDPYVIPFAKDRMAEITWIFGNGNVKVREYVPKRSVLR